MSPRYLATVAVFLLAAAPGGAQPRIALQYDDALAKADFPSPAARLTINGRTAWFLFDTGAGVHVMASWFAKAAGLEAGDVFTDGVHGIDSTGKTLPLRGLRDLSATRDDGGAMALGQVAITDFPPEFERSGVGGALSPQLLAGPGQATALDLRVPELRFEPFRDAVHRLGARVVPRERAQFCGSRDDPVPNFVFAIQVKARRREGVLLLDSGATATKVLAQSAMVHDLRLESGGETLGIAGQGQAFSVARRLRIQFAGYRATVDARVVDLPARPCNSDGLLGLDALRRCALVVGQQELAIRCGR